MSYYPSLESLLQTEQDGLLLKVKRSLRSIIKHFIYLIISLIVVLLLNIYYPNLSFPQTVPILHYFTVRWLGLIPIFFLLEIVRRHHDDLYVLTRHRIEHHDGRLSLTYNIPNVRVMDVRGIIVSQGIWGRILDYGDIELGTAAQNEPELILTGVRAPYNLACLIDQIRTYSNETSNVENSPASSAE